MQNLSNFLKYLKKVSLDIRFWKIKGSNTCMAKMHKPLVKKETSVLSSIIVLND